MRFFLAGIMQGSHLAATIHNQDYRVRIKQLLGEYFPGADIYDPLADHAGSLGYDAERGRTVFFHHNRLCGEVDVVLAFVPEASMGTAVEMWEGHRNGKFVSHARYTDLDEFEESLTSGRLAEKVQDFFKK
jgi:hypothetical protein